jgi:anaerobic selenocysteine-containing dehydrogenase
MATSNGVQRIPGYCALCTSSCGCISFVEDGRLIAVEPDPAHPTGKALCGKGRAAPELVHHEERLLHPLRRVTPKGDPKPRWQRISWDEALDETAAALKRLVADGGPESVAFGITTPSGTGVQDAYPWLERLRNAFGSPNTPFGTEICNFHRDNVYAYTFGVDTPMPDFEHTECIILWGHNPSTTWLAYASRVAEAKARGAKLIVIDPRRAGLAVKADSWLRVRPGSDGALALGLAHLLIEEDRFDAAFVREWTNGPHLVRADGGMLAASDIIAGADDTLRVAWDESAGAPVVYDPATASYRGDASALALTGQFDIGGADGSTISCRPAFDLYAERCREFTPERVEEISWVPAAELREAARLIAEAGSVACYSWSGVAQHSNASQTSRAIALLYALTGSFDDKGGNVLFDTIPVASISGAELLAPEQLAKAVGGLNRPLGPERHGWITTDDLYRAILEGEPYPIKGMVSFGTNVLVSHADTARGATALKALDFAVHIDMFMTPSAELADIVLPVNTPWEREGLCTNFKVGADATSFAQLRPPVVESRGESKSDIWIAFELAKRLGLAEQFWDGDIDASYREMLAPSGLSLEQLRQQPSGVHVPGETRYRKYAGNGTGAAGFATPSRKVEIFSEMLQAAGQAPLPDYVEPAVGPKSRPDLATDYPLVLTSAKSLHYCHSQHRGLPSLRKREPDPLIEIHPDAAAARDIADGDWVRLATPDGAIRARAKLRDSLDPRVVSATHGWWQACTALGLPGYDATSTAGANINLAIGNKETDPISGSVPHRSYLCEVSRAPNA